MDNLPKILLLEDNARDAQLVQLRLDDEGLRCKLEVVRKKEEYEKAIVAQEWDLIVSDFTLPGYDGLSALRLKDQINPGIPFIFFSGTVGEDQAIESLRLGAIDYVLKAKPVRLIAAVKRALAEAATRKEKIRASEALRKSEARYRSLVSATALLLWVTDSYGMVVEDQPTWRAFTGQSTDEILGLGWMNAIHPDEIQEALMEWKTAIEKGIPFEAEYRLRRFDGEFRPFSLGAAPVLRQDGSVAEWMGACTDITHRRSLEEKLHHAQKLEAIGTLAGGIAHDFNNILGAIGGFVELAKFHSQGNSTIVELLDEVSIATARATSLVQQILTFSRREEEQLKQTHLKPIIEEAYRLVCISKPANVELVMDLDAEIPMVQANSTQIHQIVMNLCTNAIQAIGANPGKVFVKLENVECDGIEPSEHSQVRKGRYVRLTISDTGSGMDEGTIERIFEPFFTTKAPGLGTGLGLAVVHGIVESHGGTVVVSSEVGVGTTFYMYFPVRM